MHTGRRTIDAREAFELEKLLSMKVSRPVTVTVESCDEITRKVPDGHHHSHKPPIYTVLTAFVESGKET